MLHENTSQSISANMCLKSFLPNIQEGPSHQQIYSATFPSRYCLLSHVSAVSNYGSIEGHGHQKKKILF
jgi:hypothetical protein